MYISITYIVMFSAVQHERKPIIDKKDYGSTSTSPYPTNKIYIRKDLGSDTTNIINSTFNPCDVTYPFLNKRIGKLVILN